MRTRFKAGNPVQILDENRILVIITHADLGDDGSGKEQAVDEAAQFRMVLDELNLAAVDRQPRFLGCFSDDLLVWK